MANKVLIVDGNSLIFRAYHALPLMDYEGAYTNAVQGFFSMLLKAIETYQIDYCVTCFDEKGPTFRHEQYEDYKAGRSPTPKELEGQFPIIKELLEAMGLGAVSLAGFEADDLLGTLAKRCSKEGMDALLLTGDKDTLQLVRDNVTVLYTKRGISDLGYMTPEAVKEEYGITPQQVPDWKGMMGDSSDNIPGIPGVGNKTAVKLLSEYGSMEKALENADKIKGKLGERIRANKEQAVFSKELATIVTDAPVEVNVLDYPVKNLAQAVPAFMQYGLRTLSRRLKNFESSAQESEAVETPDNIPAQTVDFEGWKKALKEFSGACALHFTPTMATALLDGKLVSLPLQSDLPLLEGNTQESAATQAASLLQNPPIVHDGKRYLYLTQGKGQFSFDTMIAAYLLSPQEKNYLLSSFEEDSALGVMRLYEKQKTQLLEEELDKLYRKVELPLVSALYRMEEIGFQVDEDVLMRLGNQYTKEIDRLRETAIEKLGVEPFNLNSPQQLSKALFEDLKLPPKGRRSASGSYSTDAEALEGLTGFQPGIEEILAYRQVSKLQSTYIEPLMRNRDAFSRVHTTFNQTGTATGRISSNDPNLQNIPTRTPLGREVRRAFIAKDGHVLVDGDYSQIELRVLAHMSGDEEMTRAFQKGEDIHRRAAALVNSVPIEEVTPEMRAAAKAVNFGIVYGISDFGLARNLGIGFYEASELIKNYFEKYPGIKAYMDEAKKFGYENGYARTLFGRRRYLPELKKGGNIRQFGERAAMNAPIQGTAADIIKIAMVRVDEALRQNKMKTRLILQVHDELILEAPVDEMEQAKKLLQESMESAARLSVPLISQVSIGKSWYECK